MVEHIKEIAVSTVATQRAQYVATKKQQADAMRKQAVAAKGVGKSLRNLAPVVVGELRSVVGLVLRTGRLQEQWSAALEAAEKSEVAEDERTLAAVAAILVEFANEAGKRIMQHGDILVEKRGTLIGKAAGIEEMLAELAETVPENGTGNGTSPPDSESPSEDADGA